MKALEFKSSIYVIQCHQRVVVFLGRREHPRAFQSALSCCIDAVRCLPPISGFLRPESVSSECRCYIRRVSSLRLGTSRKFNFDDVLRMILDLGLSTLL